MIRKTSSYGFEAGNASLGAFLLVMNKGPSHKIEGSCLRKWIMFFQSGLRWLPWLPWLP